MMKIDELNFNGKKKHNYSSEREWDSENFLGQVELQQKKKKH